MSTLCKSFLLAGIAAAAVSGTARGADERLLVVVETASGAGVDARDVRQTIGTELGIPVIAPGDAAAAGASNVLIVAVDRTDIRMSLRGSAAGLVARTIRSPVDRPARLREIGWLAGNLARDQVSGIVAVPAERATAPSELLIAAADAAPATAPPPVPAPPELPAATATPQLGGDPAVSVSAGRPDATVASSARWTITAAGGPTAAYDPGGVYPGGAGAAVVRDMNYQLEVHRQASPEGLIFGAALDAGPNSSSSQLIGIAGLIGSDWRHRRWFLEATAGVGLELARLPVESRTVTNSSLVGSSSETTTSASVQPVLYLRGAATVGFPLSRSLDLIAGLGLHVASSGGFATDFLSATAGLRFRIL